MRIKLGLYDYIRKFWCYGQCYQTTPTQLTKFYDYKIQDNK